MTVPVSPTSKMSPESHAFMSFDEKVCRLIFDCLHEDFQAYLDKGLCPDYCLKTDVSWKEEGLVFKKGSSLIFIIIRCCTVSTTPWDLWMMMTLLLDKGVALDKRVEGEGGGETDVLEFACENANLISEDILCTLLKSASSEFALFATEKIKDPQKKESILRHIFPDCFPQPHALSLISPEPLLLSSSPPPLIFNEEEIYSCLVEGDSEKLRALLESGLSPDYVLTKDIIVGGFVCEKGASLLLSVLQICVSTNDFFYYLEYVFLLLEKQANLEQECSETTPLLYVCEHGSMFPEEFVIRCLTSVSKVSAFHVVSKISDLEYKERMASLIHSEELVFRCASDEEDKEKKEIQRIKEELLAVTDIFGIETSVESFLFRQSIFGKKSISEEKATLSSDVVFSLTSEEPRLSPEPSTISSRESVVVSENISDKEEESDFSLGTVFKKLTEVTVNIENLHSINASFCYVEKINKLLEQIIFDDFSGLENILRNPELLRTCNEEVRDSTCGEETLLSILLRKLNNPGFKHKVCCLFLKYGLPKEEKIYGDLNLLGFLCSFRPGNKALPLVLLQTVLLVILFYNDETLTKEAVQHCKIESEKERILFFFTDDKGKFSIQYIYLPIVVSDRRFNEFTLAFLEASLLLNRNVITDKAWDSRIIFPLLEALVSFLKKQSLLVESLSIKRKMIMVGLFETLLATGIHSYSYKEENKDLYIQFFNKHEQVMYESSQIKKEVGFLLQKYWKWIVDKEDPSSEDNLLISGPKTFLGLFNECTGNYGTKISEVAEAIKVNDFSKLEDLLRDKQAFNECTREVKSFSGEETCFSALLHIIKDAVFRHRIFIIFLRYGLSLSEIVYENMNVFQFLCKLRGNILILNTNKHLLLQTICLGLFLLEDNSWLIKAVISNCCLEDARRLKEFFYNKITGKFSNKNLCLEDNINNSIYFLVKKTMLEASLIVNKNIITNKPLNVTEINSWLGCLVKSLSTISIGFQKPLSTQENAVNRKNRFLYIYEFLLIFLAAYQFSSKERLIAYASLKQQVETLKWKNGEIKSFLLMLLQRHLGFVIQESRKRKGSPETEIPEKRLKLSETTTPMINLEKVDVFYMSRECGSKVEAVLTRVTNENFSLLEEIIKNPSLLEEYDREVGSHTNNQETLLSILLLKLKDIGIQNRICCLFLKYGLSLSMVVSKNCNILEFVCSVKRPHSTSSILKIICLFVFAFKNELSWDSVINTCRNMYDLKKLQEFFVNSQGNFSVSAVDLDSVFTKTSSAALIQAFISASVCLNRNVITDEPLNTDFIFSWIHRLLKILVNIRKTSPIGMYRRNASLSIFETLLIEAIQENSYKITDINEYILILRRKFVFKNPDIKQQVEALIQKHWGFLLEKHEEKSPSGEEEK